MISNVTSSSFFAALEYVGVELRRSYSPVICIINAIESIDYLIIYK